MGGRSWLVAMVMSNLLVAFAPGCSGSSGDGRTVAGRTRSLSRASDLEAAPGTSGRLRLRRTSEQATGMTAAALEADLEGLDLVAAVLRLPTGEEVAMTAGQDAYVAALEGTPEALDARCPPGGYTFSARATDGSTLSLTLEVVGAAPATPVIVAPTDMAVVPAGALAVAWTWEGTAALFDVDVIDAANGERAYHAGDVAGLEHLVPAGALEAGRRYRLEVTSASAPSTSPVRLEATAAIVVDAGAP